MWKDDGKGNYVYGDYVLTKVNNSFNNKVSYWISKRGYTKAYYCFTYLNEQNLKEMLNTPTCWIKYFEDMNKE